MKTTSKLLASILILGITYSFYKAFTGEGGSGLYDFVDAISYSSVVLFIVSLTIILINIRHLKKHIDTIVFMIIGLPLTFSTAMGELNYYNYNRGPDLTVNYPETH